jgi:hypothetical protein
VDGHAAGSGSPERKELAMTCPQCTGRVPSKALWTSTGLSGVVCPHCHAHLCPKASCAVILFAVCIGLGEATLLVLQRRGVNFALGLLGFFVIFAGVYLLAAPGVIKLRVKDNAGRPLAGRRV